MLFKKLSLLNKEYSETNIVKGSPVTYFIFFWLTKVFSLLQQKSDFLNRLLHKVARVLPKPTFTIQNKSGIFFVQAFDDSTTICSDYFEEELRGWLTTPDTKDVFVDIGANRGIYTMITPSLFKYKEIHSFEPNPNVVTLLTKNVELNGLDKMVTIHNVALGEAAGSLPFTCDPMHLGGGRIVSTASSETISVPVKVFDELTPNIPPTRISFIKIDTEGFEQSVLNGMKATLSNMNPGSCIMIESTEPEKVQMFLGTYGFTLEKSNQHDHLFIKRVRPCI
jgi:FkbM family methyltransferase